jgi:hypothetical protein
VLALSVLVQSVDPPIVEKYREEADRVLVVIEEPMAVE